MQAVKSSNVRKIGFEKYKPRVPQMGIIGVEFLGGGVYHYEPVSELVFDTIMASKSKGAAVDMFLKTEVAAGKMTCKKVK